MRIHCIGIGGIGVSALAQYYLSLGYQVSGSDLAQSEITDFLASKGVEIFIGNTSDHISKTIDKVVYSPAVKPANAEYAEAIRLGIELKSYPEALGELTQNHTTIAVSGSHGKSTTTAMVALILEKAGIDPTVIVGTKLKEFGGSNFRKGHSKYLVIEACEYDGSFLDYQPTIEVITNIDKEHLDYFKTFANVKKAFRDFIKKLPKEGWLIYNNDDAATKQTAEGYRKKTQLASYSLKKPEAKKLAGLLKVPGKHNVSNALAALAVARVLGVKDSVSFAALKAFSGTWRRFEVKVAFVKTSANQRKNITVVSDYGHHPNEVKATLQAAREKFGKNPAFAKASARRRKIWLIFQPHQHQRTYYLFKDFVALFKKAPTDEIIITDIYDVAGRETETINKKIDSQTLVKKIARKNVQYMPLADAETFVKEHIKSGEVVIIMGAGDIYKLFDKF